MIYIVIYGLHDPHFDFIDIPADVFRKKDDAENLVTSKIAALGKEFCRHPRENDHWLEKDRLKQSNCNFFQILSFVIPLSPIVYIAIELSGSSTVECINEIIGVFSSQVEAKKAIDLDIEKNYKPGPEYKYNEWILYSKFLKFVNLFLIFDSRG